MKNRINPTLADLTVILPNYNHAKYLHYSLGALLRQTLRPKKIIIIDDASTDNSVEVIKAILANFGESGVDIVLICNPSNQGVNAICNHWLNLVTTKYVFFPAADDVCYEQLFAISIALLSKYPNAGLCSTRSYMIDEQGKVNGECYAPLIKSSLCFIEPEECLRIFRRDGGWILGNTRIFNAAYLRAANGFSKALLSLSDSFVAMVVACQHGACFIPKLLAECRYSRNTYSSQSSRDPECIKQMLTISNELLRAKYNSIFDAKDIKVVFDRCMLTFILSILRIKKINSLPDILSVVPVDKITLRKVLVMLSRLQILRFPSISAVILYAVIRPYDLWRRVVRGFYRPFLLLKLKLI